MRERRDIYRYKLKVGNKVVHIGLTTDLERREREHQKEFPRAKIVKMGRRTTREAALRWEREKLNKVRIEPRELQKLSPGARSKLLKHKDKILGMLDERG